MSGVQTLVSRRPSGALADRSWAKPLIVGLPVCVLLTLLVPFDRSFHYGRTFGDLGHLFAVGAIAAVVVAATFSVLRWRLDGQTIPGAVLAKLGQPSGSVCIFNSAPTHLIIDVGGAF